jgi:hypothetical protein
MMLHPPQTLEASECGRITINPGDSPDEEVTYGVAKMLPVIVWDRGSKGAASSPCVGGFRA